MLFICLEWYSGGSAKKRTKRIHESEQLTQTTGQASLRDSSKYYQHKAPRFVLMFLAPSSTR